VLVQPGLDAEATPPIPEVFIDIMAIIVMR
jgi:hypothetical protein